MWPIESPRLLPLWLGHFVFRTLVRGMRQFEFHAIRIFEPDRVVTAAVVHFTGSIQNLELMLLEELMQIIHLLATVGIPRHVTESGRLFIVAFSGACFSETHDDQISNPFLLSVKNKGPVATVFKISQIIADHIVEDFGLIEVTDSKREVVD